MKKYNKSLFLPEVSYNEIKTGRNFFRRQIKENHLGSFLKLNTDKAVFVNGLFLNKINLEFKYNHIIYLRKNYYDRFTNNDLLLKINYIDVKNSDDINPKELLKDGIITKKHSFELAKEKYNLDVLTDANDIIKEFVFEYNFEIFES